MRAARAAGFVLPALIVNAAVQAVLVLPDPVPALSPGFLLGAVLSGLVALGTYALIVVTTVAADRRAMARALRNRGARFALWTTGLAVLAAVGSLVLLGIPGLVILAAMPYVPIAAMAVDRNPIGANLAAIRRRPVGYVGRVILSAVLALVLYLQSALTTFFVTGAAATAITMSAWGLVAWWLTRLWAKGFERAQDAG